MRFQPAFYNNVPLFMFFMNKYLKYDEKLCHELKMCYLTKKCKLFFQL